MKKLLLCFFILSRGAAALACPVCSSPRAMQVRTYLFGPELSGNLFALLLPFAIFAAIAAFLYYFDLPFIHTNKTDKHL